MSAYNNIYLDHIFFSYPERGQGAHHVPALGPFAVHRVVFEMPASRGRTENPVGRPSQSPVGFRYTREESSLMMAYAHSSPAGASLGKAYIQYNIVSGNLAVQTLTTVLADFV